MAVKVKKKAKKLSGIKKSKKIVAKPPQLLPIRVPKALPRAEVIKKIWKYIKKHELTRQKARKMFLGNKSFKSVVKSAIFRSSTAGKYIRSQLPDSNPKPQPGPTAQKKKRGE